MEKILSRIKGTRQNTLRLPNALDRYNSVKDSMQITRELTEEGNLLLDDVKTTGITILEAKKILLEAGAKKTVTVCLGINSSIDRNGE
jgi:predicted amidophosphoribosyltransferase